MPPPTPPVIALRSLLSEIELKKTALAATSDAATRSDDADDLEDIVRHCVQTDAMLTVAQAVVLASLHAKSLGVQS